MKIKVVMLAVGIFTLCAFVFMYYQITETSKLRKELDDIANVDPIVSQDIIKPVVSIPDEILPDYHLKNHNHKNETIKRISVPNVVKHVHTKLTYHKELLETNPVEALRLQSKERGHWSSEWIPAFPSDDLEAGSIAKNEYIIQYYKSIGDTNNLEYKKAYDSNWEQMTRQIYAPFNARLCDLIMLHWTGLSEGSVLPLYKNGIRRMPSDYFPLYESQLK